jgi:hypothetical protein
MKHFESFNEPLTSITQCRRGNLIMNKYTNIKCKIHILGTECGVRDTGYGEVSAPV